MRSSISRLVAEALAQVLGLDDDVAEARAGRDVDLDLVELDVALLGDAAPRSCCRRAFCLVWRPLGFWRTHSSSAAIVRWRAVSLLLLLREALLLLLEPARVVALEGDAAAAVELEDPAGDVVEEVAIVGDGHDGALVLGEVALEPRDRLGVEVVGGLVEQQQVGRARAAAGTARRGGARRRRAW